jgi:hypothetical protein
MTLSDHKGKQIISDTIQKPFLQDFRTMFITAPLADIHHLQDPHVIHSYVMRHFDQHSILTDSQHGFRKQRSCETNLIITVHQIAQQFANGAQVDVFMLVLN